MEENRLLIIQHIEGRTLDCPMSIGFPKLRCKGGGQEGCFGRRSERRGCVAKATAPEKNLGRSVAGDGERETEREAS